MNAMPATLGALRGTALTMLFLMHTHIALAAPATKKAYFDDNSTPNVIALLPMPPEAGSQEEAADRESSLAIFNARTPEQIALGKSQNKLTVYHFSTSLGAWFQKAKLPKTEALFAQLDREVMPLILSAKKYYQRPHPSQIDSTLFADVIAKDDAGAYPSGHSTRGTLYALLLCELLPAQRSAIHQQGREMGWLRVQGGVESPLDAYAGRVLGRALAYSLMRNPDFLADFEGVRQELSAAAAAAK